MPDVQAKANVPKPLADAKSKIKNSPAATIGLPAFELADLQGQNNQSENYPSPGKDSFKKSGPLQGKGGSVLSPPHPHSFLPVKVLSRSRLPFLPHPQLLLRVPSVVFKADFIEGCCMICVTSGMNASR